MVALLEQAVRHLAGGVVGIGDKVEGSLDSQDIEQAEHLVEQGALRRANTKRAATAQTCLRTSWASNAGNSRRTVSSRITLSSMDSLSGWTRQRARNPSRSVTSSGTCWSTRSSTPSNAN